VHGSHSFDAAEFVYYLRRKRSIFLISSAVAVVLTLAVSVMLPKRYTAKSSVLISAPAGNDPRAATAVSSVYLESLKTYESFASSDTLFRRALDHLHLEASKPAVLKVSRPGGTTVLEIAVTLHDARQAQALAQYVAEQTVELGRTIDAESANDLTMELRRQAQAAQDRFGRSSRARIAFAESNPIEALENDLHDGSVFQYRLEQDLVDLKSPAAAEARIAAIENQRRELIASLKTEGAQLDARKSRRDQLEEEERSARADYEDIAARLNATLSSAQYRGERLHILDPGVVPPNPAFPNTPLNVIAALLASIAVTFICVAVRFSYVRLQRESSERVYSLR
jgi:uncharacterized protein involved in exopolysaccharide biosynthesis